MGFKCTVLFGQTKEGVIKQGSSFVPGMEVLKDADMLFLFLRFLHPDDESVAHFGAYIDRGGPILGLRTTTHAFNGIKGKYARYNYNNRDPNEVTIVGSKGTVRGCRTRSASQRVGRRIDATRVGPGRRRRRTAPEQIAENVDSIG